MASHSHGTPNSESFLRPKLDQATSGTNPPFPEFLSFPHNSQSRYVTPDTISLPNPLDGPGGDRSTGNHMYNPNSIPSVYPVTSAVYPSHGHPVSVPDKQCQNCTDLSRRVENLEKEFRVLKVNAERPIHTDGTFIWSIHNVSKRKEEAPGGYLESAVFYTAMFGYKLQGCAYLKGDGKVNENNLSIYIMILKGEHDSLLKWPFQHPVSVILMDQSLRELDIIKTFRPTQSSSCFKQPLDPTKRPTGFPNFLPLSDLKEPFLVDGVMFIRFLIHSI